MYIGVPINQSGTLSELKKKVISFDIKFGGFAMTQEKMNRISELSKKSRTVGLSNSEKAEQKALREEYIRDIRKNFKNTLESIEFTDKQ